MIDITTTVDLTADLDAVLAVDPGDAEVICDTCYQFVAESDAIPYREAGEDSGEGYTCETCWQTEQDAMIADVNADLDAMHRARREGM